MTPDEFDEVVTEFSGLLDYPYFYATCEDGGTLCFFCCRDEARIIRAALDSSCPDDRQWKVVEVNVNDDNEEKICDHCYTPIMTMREPG